jgi:hypothetical protein
LQILQSKTTCTSDCRKPQRVVPSISVGAYAQNFTRLMVRVSNDPETVESYSCSSRFSIFLICLIIVVILSLPFFTSLFNTSPSLCCFLLSPAPRPLTHPVHHFFVPLGGRLGIEKGRGVVLEKHSYSIFGRISSSLTVIREGREGRRTYRGP